MSDFDTVKFLKVLALTTSSNDGEALNAIRMANVMLAKVKKRWEDVVTCTPVQPGPYSKVVTTPASPPPAPSQSPYRNNQQYHDSPYAAQQNAYSSRVSDDLSSIFGNAFEGLF